MLLYDSLVMFSDNAERVKEVKIVQQNPDDKTVEKVRNYAVHMPDQ